MSGIGAGGHCPWRDGDRQDSGGITREALYKALRPDSAPRFDTVSRVCAALGVRLVAQPVHPASDGVGHLTRMNAVLKAYVEAQQH